MSFKEFQGISLVFKSFDELKNESERAVEGVFDEFFGQFQEVLTSLREFLGGKTSFKEI